MFILVYVALISDFFLGFQVNWDFFGVDIFSFLGDQKDVLIWFLCIEDQGEEVFFGILFQGGVVDCWCLEIFQFFRK